MPKQLYRFTIDDSVAWEDVESSLVLALMGVESLHGAERARLEAAHVLDRDKRTLVVDASSQVGRDLNRLFVGYLRREFGDDAFQVESIDSARQPQAVA